MPDMIIPRPGEVLDVTVTSGVTLSKEEERLRKWKEDTDRWALEHPDEQDCEYDELHDVDEDYDDTDVEVEMAFYMVRTIVRHAPGYNERQRKQNETALEILAYALDLGDTIDVLKGEDDLDDDILFDS